MDPIRIAAVSYLNTLPLIAGLDRVAGVELTPAVPSKIVGLVATGKSDIGLVSLIDAAHSPIPLTMLPVGMIGCDGPTLTVRLSSRVPPGQITTLHTDTHSHTSVVLARIILDRVYGVRPEIRPLDAVEPGQTGDWPESVLLIGDKVITGSPPGDDHPHRLDLGAAWKDLTGLPFVYAVWMCRSEDAEAPIIKSAAALLDRQRRFNTLRLGGLIEQGAQGHGWPKSLADQYLRSLLRYQVDPPHREAIGRFFEMAATQNFIKPFCPIWSDKTGCSLTNTSQTTPSM